MRGTAFAVLAALPLVAALLALRWLHPEPGPLLSLGALSAGAVYVLAVQVRLFASQRVGVSALKLRDRPRTEALISSLFPGHSEKVGKG